MPVTWIRSRIGSVSETGAEKSIFGGLASSPLDCNFLLMSGTVLVFGVTK